MAERIESLSRIRGRATIYPWSEWMDGSAWRIVQGEDFEVPATSMAGMVRIVGRKYDQPAKARVIEGGTVVEFQFAPPAEVAA